MKLKNFLPGLIFLAVALVLVALTDLEDKPNFFPSMVGKEIPVFKTETLAGGEISDAKFKTNKVINFWASWCVACKAEHGQLLKLQEQGFAMIGVNSGDNKERGLEYLANYKNPFEVNVYDPKRTLAIAMGVTGMPETFVVDKDGIIKYHFRGALTDNEVANNLMPILNEKD